MALDGRLLDLAAVLAAHDKRNEAHTIDTDRMEALMSRMVGSADLVGETTRVR